MLQMNLDVEIGANAINWTQVQSLAVNPGQGKLFWSDVGVDQMKHAIYMANMDGTERQALVTQQTNPELDFPKSLSFDVKSKQSL